MDLKLTELRARLESPQAFSLDTSEDIYRVPVLFDSVPDPPGTPKALAITPDLVNSAVYGSLLIAPDPFLHASTEEDTDVADFICDRQNNNEPDLNGDGKCDTLRDPFKIWLDQNLPPGITAAYIDNWSIYHIEKGEVHCSSNEKRSVPVSPKWWTNAP